VPYDEVDAAVPRGGGARAQALVELRQRLVRRDGDEVLRLDLGQGIRLLAPGQGTVALGESYGRLSTHLGWLRGLVQARVDPALGRLTRLGGSLSFDDGRGHGVLGSYESLLDDGSDRLRAPIDLLFGDAVSSTSTEAHLVSGSAWWNFGPVGVRYDVLIVDRLQPTDAHLTYLSLGQHTLTVSFTPACDCWRLDVSAIQRLKPDLTLNVPEFGASLTVSRFGSIGTR
jgi:LPS-assembly protein